MIKPTFAKEVYQERRARLQKTMGNGLLLFLGNGIASYNYPDNNYMFRQDSTFLYLFGLDYEGLAAVIDVDNDRTIIFGDELTIDDIIWTGVQPTIAEKAAGVGVTETRPMAELQTYVQNAMKQNQQVHFIPPYRGHTIMWLWELVGKDAQPSLDLIYALADMRNHKSAEEIEEIAKAVDITVKMHETAIRMVRPGVTEKEVAAAICEVAQREGYYLSFPTIATNHGETLHNHGYIHTLQDGDMLLLDAGAETEMHYAGDCTTTMPVGATFTERQKAVHDILLDTYQKAGQMIRPGITYRECHVAAWANIAEGLKGLGLMKGDAMEAAEAGAVAMFMPHGLGHMMGMDVHDMENLGQRYVGYTDTELPSDQFGLCYLRCGRELEEGFVMTDEPGIYFIPALIDDWKSQHKFEDFINYDLLDTYRDFGGIRIEDDILITKDGCRFLGESRIPYHPNDVEEFIAANR